MWKNSVFCAHEFKFVSWALVSWALVSWAVLKNSFREHSFREQRQKTRFVKLVSWAEAKNSFREQFHEFREQKCSRVCSRDSWAENSGTNTIIVQETWKIVKIKKMTSKVVNRNSQSKVMTNLSFFKISWFLRASAYGKSDYIAREAI